MVSFDLDFLVFLVPVYPVEGLQLLQGDVDVANASLLLFHVVDVGLKQLVDLVLVRSGQLGYEFIRTLAASENAEMVDCFEIIGSALLALRLSGEVVE